MTQTFDLTLTTLNAQSALGHLLPALDTASSTAPAPLIAHRRTRFTSANRSPHRSSLRDSLDITPCLAPRAHHIHPTRTYTSDGPGLARGEGNAPGARCRRRVRGRCEFSRACAGAGACQGFLRERGGCDDTGMKAKGSAPRVERAETHRSRSTSRAGSATSLSHRSQAF